MLLTSIATPFAGIEGMMNPALRTEVIKGIVLRHDRGFSYKANLSVPSTHSACPQNHRVPSGR